MKPLLFCCFLLASFAEAKSALPYDPATQKYTYSGVLNVDSANADSSYNRTKAAISKLFVGRDIPQVNNATTKQVVGKRHVKSFTSDELISAILGRFGLY